MCRMHFFHAFRSAHYAQPLASDAAPRRKGNALGAVALFIVFCGLFASGCDSSNLIEDQTHLTLRVDPFIGDASINGHRTVKEQIVSGGNYRVNGRRLSLHTAHLYLSEVTLIRADGTTRTFFDENPFTFTAKKTSGESVPHTVREKVFLFQHSYGQTTHALGLVETGEYAGIRFKIGLEGLTNRIVASEVSAALHPLGARGNFTTHWSTEEGYIFLRMDGRVDTDGDGQLDSSWAVHLGTDEFVNTLTFENSFTLSTSEVSEIHLKVDYGQLIAGLDYSNPDERISQATNNLPVARKVDAEIPKAFSFEGVNRIVSNGTSSY